MEAWLDLLCLAQYRPSRINNKGQVQTLEVGQLMGARAFLAGRWNWSEKTVRGFMDGLEAEGMIARGAENDAEKGQQNGHQRANKCSIITICNYSRYQLLEDAITAYVGQAKGPAEGQQGASEGPAKGQNLTLKHLNTETKEVKKEDVADATPAAAAALPALIEFQSSASAEQGIDPIAAFNDYNDLALRAGLPLARALTPQRKKRLVARIREHGGMDAWATALANIERSAFLRGQNARGWRASFDFMLQAESFAKLVDGAYGNGAHAMASTTESSLERTDRLVRDARERMGITWERSS